MPYRLQNTTTIPLLNDTSPIHVRAICKEKKHLTSGKPYFSGEFKNDEDCIHKIYVLYMHNIYVIYTYIKYVIYTYIKYVTHMCNIYTYIYIYYNVYYTIYIYSNTILEMGQSIGIGIGQYRPFSWYRYSVSVSAKNGRYFLIFYPSLIFC